MTRCGGEEFVIALRDIGVSTVTDLAEPGMTAIRNLEVLLGGMREPTRMTDSMTIARLRHRKMAAASVERTD